MSDLTGSGDCRVEALRGVTAQTGFAEVRVAVQDRAKLLLHHAITLAASLGSHDDVHQVEGGGSHRLFGDHQTDRLGRHLAAGVASGDADHRVRFSQFADTVARRLFRVADVDDRLIEARAVDDLGHRNHALVHLEVIVLRLTKFGFHGAQQDLREDDPASGRAVVTVSVGNGAHGHTLVQHFLHGRGAQAGSVIVADQQTGVLHDLGDHAAESSFVSLRTVKVGQVLAQRDAATLGVGVHLHIQIHFHQGTLGVADLDLSLRFHQFFLRTD